MAVQTFMDALWVESSYFEFCFLLCFALGFMFFRLDLLAPKARKKTKLIDEPAAKPFANLLKKAADGKEGPQALLKAWRDGRDKAPTPPDMLRPVAQALLEFEPRTMVEQLVDHMRRHPMTLRNTRTAMLFLEIAARAVNIEVMERLAKAFRMELQLQPSLQTYEVLFGGYATAGKEARVAELLAEMAAARIKMSARAHSLLIKGFLKNSKIDAVIEQFQQMHTLGLQVPTFAALQLFRIAGDAGRVKEAFDAVEGLTSMTSESVVVLLEHCSKTQDLAFAKRVEKLARDSKLTLTSSAYDPLLKVYAVNCDFGVMALFEEMQVSNVRISDGLCVGLIARCAEAKFLRLAEEIVRFVRARGGMTVAMYSALMKVYAYCGMYDSACDLYDRICEDGLQPDSIMYGCLMKFAVECGRTDLSRKLSELVPTLDIHNYMSLIRACGRDKDVNRAFALLDRLKASNVVAVDVAVCNCVLDVCVTAGNLVRARELAESMRRAGSSDIITYNTLLKGHCQAGDLCSAKKLLEEMREAGQKPNDVSYNCLVNAAVNLKTGDLREAWAIVDMMEKDGISPDHYTLSIIMKALKRVRGGKDVQRALVLLDRTQVNICSDEILLNACLETCIKHHEMHRLESFVASFKKSALKASVHTYGTLIKAGSCLKDIEQCWVFWRTMEQRCMVPSAIVLGCMLDALVSNLQIDEAVNLLNQWKDRVPPNTVIYSTIFKGLANTQQSVRAMSLWRQMRVEGVEMNTVLYNSVIDAQARVGNMDNVSELVEAMEVDGVRPDNISCSTIAKGYCMKGDLNMAFEVFRNMQKDCMVQDSIVYNTIMDGCIRHNRLDLADKLLEDMEANDIAPSNFTLGILVKLYSRRRQLDKAFDRIESLSKRFNFTPNSQVLSCLVCACLNNNALEMASKVFQQLRDCPSGIDAKAYSAIIGGYMRHGLLKEAVALVEEAYGLAGSSRRLAHGQAVDHEALVRLLQALARRGLRDELAVPLLGRLRGAGVNLDSRVFAMVLDDGKGAAARGKDMPRGNKLAGRRQQ